MRNLPLKLEKSLQNRKQENAFRSLNPPGGAVDFSSNDYLGFARNAIIFERANDLLRENDLSRNGATGSRLLSGNHKLYKSAEDFLANFHNSDAALIFNSGFDANTGFFSSVPGRGDLIFFDELAHASIREGISLSHAKSFKFRHNDLEDLKKKIDLQQKKFPEADVFIVTESVFSMDGDRPDLKSLAKFSSEAGCFLIIDEAHATGVFGHHGQGLVQELGIEEQVFARIYTFGKGLGCHGAAILGPSELRDFLINFSRSFIYTTALPPHSVATILAALKFLNTPEGASEITQLQRNIGHFRAEIGQNGLQPKFIESESAIHCCVVPGNQKVKELAAFLGTKGFEVRPILSPTVPKGSERLRFCLHSFNSAAEISEVLKVLGNFVQP
ncbi:MAG: 8-amino-7-oxononanoate synthase [Salegentibacter sp.]